MRRLGSMAAAVVCVLVCVPTPAGAEDAPASVTVSMKSFTFMPASITVAAGGTVTWTYDEQPTDVPPGCESPGLALVCPGHSATAATNGADGKPLFDSGVHKADGFPFTVRFDTPGTFQYFCTVHGGPNPNNPLTAMNGTVVVAATATAPAGSGSSPGPTGPTQVEAAALARTGGPGLLGPGLILFAIALTLRKRPVPLRQH